MGSAERSSPSNRFELFAVAAPGLEPIVAHELTALGLRPGRLEPGGASFGGTIDDLARANLWLRTATRVVARVGEFHARAFGELERHARRLPWERLLTVRRPVRLRVTCKKSRLYHSDAVAERLAGAIDARLGSGASFALEGGDDDALPDDAQLVVARVFHDRCTVSADSSGELLHRRGYRLATAKAPLRETLAAAMLLGSGWDPGRPLIDPLCGSGTIPIEAALLARRIAPGLYRRFAFMDWPEFDAARWERMLDDARARIAPEAPAPIQGSDRDAGAIEAALQNAERAGVGADVELRQAPLSAISPPRGPGWLVTNPPYGARVGDRDTLRNLYSQLGNVARAKAVRWTLAFLSPAAELETRVGVELATVFQTRNGGIPVRLVRGRVGGAVKLRSRR
jgi:putative N6-adenine-specific DNA methylase